MPLKTERATKPLTPRQLQLLRAIGAFGASRCYSPTIAELACQAGISRSTVFEHIGELRRKGFLSACVGRARSLRLTWQGQELLEKLDEQNRRLPAPESAGIPLAGRVAAGLPIEAVEERELLSLSSHFAPSDCLFALEVKGNSMLGEDIRDGDYVICRKSGTAGDGQLVIAKQSSSAW
jgi:repressor LexA